MANIKFFADLANGTVLEFSMNAQQIRSEIVRLQLQLSDWNIEGRLDSDVEAEIIGEVEGLQEELHLIEDFEPAGAGGLNLDLFVAAFGATPQELGW